MAKTVNADASNMPDTDPRFGDGPAADEDLSFTCPRCSREVEARFYGPCGDCRMEMRAALSGESRDVEAAEYEPKMNVTPNAIATKD